MEEEEGLKERELRCAAVRGYFLPFIHEML